MVTFQVNDMTCGHCASTIAKALATVDKSARIEVDVPHKLVRVISESPAAELAAAIQDAGYTPQKVKAELATAAAPRAATGCGCGCGPRKAAPVDASRAAAPAVGSCCG
jgi:copper chaperone